MVLVTENEYDGGSDGGDGNLTRLTQHVDGSTTPAPVEQGPADAASGHQLAGQSRLLPKSH